MTGAGVLVTGSCSRAMNKATAATEAAKAAALAVELASLHADYLGLLGEIKAMKNALGL